MPAPAQPLPEISFLRRMLIATAVISLGVATVLALWYAIDVLLLGFAGILLGIMLYTMSMFLVRWIHLPYWLALILICLALIAALGGTAWLFGAQISAQGPALYQHLGSSLQQLEARLQHYRWGPWLISTAQSEAHTWLQQIISRNTVGIFSRTVLYLLVVLFVGLFVAATPGLYMRGLLHLIPMNRRERIAAVLGQLRHTLWWWLVGQAAAMVFIGVVSALALWLLGVPMAGTLGLIAAILNFIPNVGPIVAAIPPILLALVLSPMKAVWVAVIYLLIQEVQDHVVTPVVQQEAARIPAAILLLVQILMLFWAGILGMALAPPLAAAAIVITQMLYIKDTLGDPLTPATTPDRAQDMKADT